MSFIESLRNRLFSWKRYGRKTPRDYLHTAFGDGVRYYVELAELFRRFAKEGMREQDFSRYFILLSKGSRYSRFSGVYRDAQYGFVLCNGGKFDWKIGRRLDRRAIAVIAFNIEDNSIVVRQIQGVRQRAKELKSFRWEKLLLQIVIDWARAHNYATVKVIKAEHNSWYRDGRSASMRLHYDVTAKRMGFRLDALGEMWILELGKV